MKGKSTFSDKSPICLLGNFYSSKNSNSSSDTPNSFSTFKIKISKNFNNSNPIQNEEEINENKSSFLPYEKFSGDFKSKIWFTYRYENVALVKQHLTDNIQLSLLEKVSSYFLELNLTQIVVGDVC